MYSSVKRDFGMERICSFSIVTIINYIYYIFIFTFSIVWFNVKIKMVV